MREKKKIREERGERRDERGERIPCACAADSTLRVELSTPAVTKGRCVAWAIGAQGYRMRGTLDGLGTAGVLSYVLMDFNENVNKHDGFSPSQASKNCLSIPLCVTARPKSS